MYEQKEKASQEQQRTLSADSFEALTTSIIIPTLNEEYHITSCIESIMNSDYPRDKYEIIVVDNGSTDNTLKIAKSFNLKVIIDKQKTVGGLRNLGAKAAHGNILSFLDADCTVGPNWLEKANEVLRNVTIGVTGSCLKAPIDGNWIEQSWSLHLQTKIRKDGDVDYINSGNCFIRKEVFDAVGGFSETLETSEDVDICERIKDKGYRVYNCREMSAIHWGYPKTIKGFFKREIWHGIGGSKKDIRFFWRSKPLLLSIYNILILLLLFSGIIVNYRFLMLSICLFFVPSFLLALITSINADKLNYFFSLIALYNIYGIARTISFILIVKGYLDIILLSKKRKT